MVDFTDLALAMSRRWLVTSYRDKRYVSSTSSPRVFLHNLLMGKKGIDHRDGDGLNNCRVNLRPATHAQNMANQKKQKGTKSAYKGVRSRAKGLWVVEMEHNKTRYRFGPYQSEVEAALAYDEKALAMFGDFAWTNFPRDVALANLPPLAGDGMLVTGSQGEIR